MQNHAIQRCWFVGIVSLGLTLAPGWWRRPCMPKR